MTDRERLIEIVKNSLIKHIDKSCCLAENIVDDLLAENVTTLPVAFSDNSRERMIELLGLYLPINVPNGMGSYTTIGERTLHRDDRATLADHLLANGVIVPPCKVGDTVYVISRYYTGAWQIYSCTVEYITKYKSNSFINAVFSRDINFGVNIVEFGKTVFLTREEAEKALAERQSVSDG